MALQLTPPILTAYLDPALSLSEVAKRVSVPLDDLAALLAQASVKQILANILEVMDTRNALLAIAQQLRAIQAVRTVIEGFNAEPATLTHGATPDGAEFRRRLRDSACRAAALLLRFAGRQPASARPATSTQPPLVARTPIAQDAPPITTTTPTPRPAAQTPPQSAPPSQTPACPDSPVLPAPPIPVTIPPRGKPSPAAALLARAGTSQSTSSLAA